MEFISWIYPRIANMDSKTALLVSGEQMEWVWARKRTKRKIQFDPLGLLCEALELTVVSAINRLWTVCSSWIVIAAVSWRWVRDRMIFRATICPCGLHLPRHWIIKVPCDPTIIFQNFAQNIMVTYRNAAFETYSEFI